MDEILSPLIRQGQPLSHICSTHSKEIKVCERSIYNYIEAGKLSISNLDLRRKVKYRKRRKKQEAIKCNKFHYRQGRTYEDFQKYMEEHPDTPIIEMDTVRGLRSREQVLLTIMFNSNSVMLMILMEDESMEPVIEIFDKLTRTLGIRRFRKLFPVILTDNGRCFKNALALEYNPLENYDRNEDWTDTRNGHNSGTTSGRTNSTTTNKVSAYDAGDDLTTRGADVLVGADSSSSSGESHEGAHHLGRVHGNIGVTTSQQMLQSELDLGYWNIYEKITDLFLTNFVIPVY